MKQISGWSAVAAAFAAASVVCANPSIGVSSATGLVSAPPVPIDLLTPVVVGELPAQYQPFTGYWTASLSMAVDITKVDVVFRNNSTGAPVRASDVTHTVNLEGFVKPAPGLTGQSSGTMQRVVDFSTFPPTLTNKVKITLAITGAPSNGDTDNLFVTGPGAGAPISILPDYPAIGAGQTYKTQFFPVSTNIVVLNRVSGLFEVLQFSVSGGEFTAIEICPGDADGTLTVDFADILSALSNWGAVYGAGTGPGDADGSGAVDFNDIVSVLTNLNSDCN